MDVPAQEKGGEWSGGAVFRVIRLGHTTGRGERRRVPLWAETVENDEKPANRGLGRGQNSCGDT